MVLNSFIFQYLRMVFDQKLENRCSQKKMKSAPVGTLGVSMIPRRVWLIFGPKFKLIPKNPILGRCSDRSSLFGQSLGPPSRNNS
jgi:hypothetical protein